MFLCMLYCTLCYIYVVIYCFFFFFFLFIKLYPLKIPFRKVAKRIGYAIKLLGGFGHSIVHHSVICYAQFKSEDFERFILTHPGEKPQARWLCRDDVGFCVYPTIHTVGKARSKREKRMVRQSHLLTFVTKV